jgi:hypothetical protein
MHMSISEIGIKQPVTVQIISVDELVSLQNMCAHIGSNCYEIIGLDCTRIKW